MMVNIVVLPCELGKSVMKSIAMCDQGHCGVGSGVRRPAGTCRGVFDMLQLVQLRMNVLVSVSRVGHQKRFRRSCVVAVIPG